ncbi:EAL domain-containing protein [Noviherbaspirillum sp. CPCC 100848]|uniref:EAL domain-containing protein n=1 Tax=Noviherbaspirillum album TaxID=3080276 RepID=A0ABU6JHT9_9BURK|nr:EAL domain-containing protein [Noviherbaspirillum sp. CPCC 100848]MEC4723221.1 EAL domain-containing protein [Noviherbaspirillum sp. CPCC 100848]
MKDPRGNLRQRLRSPGGIVLLYLLFAAAWIAGSDSAIRFLFRDPDQLARIGTTKGMLFVGITSGLLFLLLSAWHASLVRAKQASDLYRERLERVLKGTNDGWWEWNLASGQIYFSPRCWELLGRSTAVHITGAETAAGDASVWREILHPEDLMQAERRIEALLTGQDSGATIEIRLRHQDGHYIPVLSRLMVQRDAGGQAVLVSGANMDMSEQKRNEERLRQSAAVFETTREGIVVLDAERRILMVNQAFTNITGYSEREVIGLSPSIMRSSRHDDDFYKGIWATVQREGHWRGEVWHRRKSGEIYPELLGISAVTNSDGALTNYVGVIADLSQLKASETRLEFMSQHDPLTSLPNRALLMSHMEHGMRLAQRESGTMALLMLDLDRFKDINDSFSHDAGDELLQQVAKCLSARMRDMDTVARLGGDEFGIVLPKLAHAEDAAIVANGILRALKQPWTLADGTEVRVGISIGISIFPDHGTSTQQLLQHADAALYQAKQEGRGGFRYFSQGMTQAARERIRLEARLHRAIEQNELRVYYQPVVDIAGGGIVGAEALVRWQHPEEGLIPPARFIPVAESTGLIDAIGEWVLRETCRQGRQWMDAGLPALTLAVNMSPRQFRHRDIGATVAEVTAQTGFPATRLELELTESALMEPDAAELLQRLRATGVRLAIDDFGTGYSSLAYLQRFPLDVLKIDKGFVDAIPHGADRGAIATSIVGMGHSLGFKVLAEGVEKPEQLAFLHSLGCDMYQGYLKSPPLPPAEFERLLSPDR